MAFLSALRVLLWALSLSGLLQGSLSAPCTIGKNGEPITHPNRAIIISITGIHPIPVGTDTVTLGSVMFSSKLVTSTVSKHPDLEERFRTCGTPLVLELCGQSPVLCSRMDQDSNSASCANLTVYHTSWSLVTAAVAQLESAYGQYSVHAAHRGASAES